jgi:hypothetical protein
VLKACPANRTHNYPSPYLPHPPTHPNLIHPVNHTDVYPKPSLPSIQSYIHLYLYSSIHPGVEGRDKEGDRCIASVHHQRLWHHGLAISPLGSCNADPSRTPELQRDHKHRETQEKHHVPVLVCAILVLLGFLEVEEILSECDLHETMAWSSVIVSRNVEE